MPVGLGVGMTEDGISVGSAVGAALGDGVGLLDGLTVGIRVGQVQNVGFVLVLNDDDAVG